MATISEAKAALSSFIAAPTEPEKIVPTLEKIKTIEMSFSMLQESEIGKLVNQVKKIVKDHEQTSQLVSAILAQWRNIANEEAAARKRKREESAGSDNLTSPVPEKKSKLAEPSSSSASSQGAASSSKPSTADSVPGPSPSLDLPTNSTRRDFVTRISESLKDLPATSIAKQTRATLDTAVMIESGTFDHFKSVNEDYKSHLKQINFHLKTNIMLRESVALSIIDPAKMATMGADDLVSEEMKAEAARIAHEVTEARKPVQLEPNCSTESCRKCHSKLVHVREAQTRSSDEPMTQFFTCLSCKMKWKR